MSVMVTMLRFHFEGNLPPNPIKQKPPSDFIVSPLLAAITCTLKWKFLPQV